VAAVGGIIVTQATSTTVGHGGVGTGGTGTADGAAVVTGHGGLKGRPRPPESRRFTDGNGAAT